VVTEDRLRLAAQALGITDPDALDRAVEVLGMVDDDTSAGHATAPVVTEIGAALAEHEGGETTAEIAGHTIRICAVSPGEFMRFSAALGGGEADIGVGFGRLIRIVVHPDDQDVCWSAIDEAGWSVEQAMTWVRERVEVATGRPTSPLSPSREQRRHPSPKSNGVSTLPKR